MSQCNKCHHPRRSNAYQQGFEDGYRAGFQNGYEVGFDETTNAFRRSTLLPSDEYALGFSDGFNAGAEVGFAQGYEAIVAANSGRVNSRPIGIIYPSPFELCSGPNCATFTLRTRNGLLRFDGYRWTRV